MRKQTEKEPPDVWLVKGLRRRVRRGGAATSRGASKRANGARANGRRKVGRSTRSAQSEWLPARGETTRSTPIPDSKPATGKRRRLRFGRDGEAESLQKRLRALAERTEKLEGDLQRERKRNRRLRAELRAEPPELNGKLDANSATFEQLRALGLSVPQCAKLIARREQKGRFRSKAELVRIPGLSQAARRTVTERLTVAR